MSFVSKALKKFISPENKAAEPKQSSKYETNFQTLVVIKEILY